MKIFVALAVAALLVVIAIFYFGSRQFDLVQATPPPVAAPKLDFSALRTLLQQDMTNIPAGLDAPRVAPASAFSVRSRLRSAATTVPEYETLGHACELIIDADKERSVRQAEAQQSAGTPLAARTEANWGTYRQQTDAEVRRLLASLPSAR